MVSAFTLYDITFLIISTLGIVWFLSTHKKNLKREGLLYLYRTRFGIKFIDNFTKKYRRILEISEWPVIISGIILMVTMTYLIVRLSWVYLTNTALVEAIRVPVVIPLIPYLPELFNIDFLPPFPFTYWIIIIAIIAIPHEFAHGIYARLRNLKIHSTGFGFLGPFLAAFVEPDEKQLNKAKKKTQLSILAAGTFANVLSTIFFGLILWLFFILAFVPAGVNFNTYSSSVLNVSEIDVPEGFSLDSEFIEVLYNNESYFVSPIALNATLERNLPLIQAFDDTPAFEERLRGSIVSVNGNKVTSFESLRNEIRSHNPGDSITIVTLQPENARDFNPKSVEYEVTLAEREGEPFLGIGVSPPRNTGILGKFYSFLSSVKDPFIYYESSIGTFGWFIYNLLWWTVLICISVALMNMLPVGIFDGGRFFMVCVWALTGSKKIGEKAFRISTWAILLLILALVLKWVWVIAL